MGRGPLLGASDWATSPRSFDAARLHLALRQFDFEALGALLAPPGEVPPEYRAQADASVGELGRALSSTGSMRPGPLRSPVVMPSSPASLASPARFSGRRSPRATPSCSTLVSSAIAPVSPIRWRAPTSRPARHFGWATGNSPRGVLPPTSTGRRVGCGAPSWCSAPRTQAVIRQHRG